MKIIKKISVILILMITALAAICPIISNATGNTVTIYGKPRYNYLLKRNGVDLTCIPLAYTKDGIEHPVYCLNLELDGATETFSYDVNIDNEITNMEIWRTIVNGYPYKTPAELGCETKEEAYLATRQAIYCSVYGRDPNSYETASEGAGDRTLNALKYIVSTARTSTETKPSSTLKINSNSSKWEIDNINSNFVSKEFTVTAAAGINNYKVEITGDLVQEMQITDTNNNPKSEFKGTEKFKILIPIKNIQNDGTFTINLTGKVATKPVLLGLSEDSTLQNVAVTGGIYEEGEGSKQEYYFKNETKIIILKQNQETKQALEGVKFQLLNSNKEVIFADLKTDEEGKIVIENLLPGKYYIQEIETLEGYEKYDKLIEVDLRLNEETKITVNNLQNDEKPEIDKINTELEVEQVKTSQDVKQEKNNYEKIQFEKEVEKLPRTGM